MGSEEREGRGLGSGRVKESVGEGGGEEKGEYVYVRSNIDGTHV